jgi:hypothetical protein
LALGSAATERSLSRVGHFRRTGVGQDRPVEDAASAYRPERRPGQGAPRDERELFIAANNGHVLAFDNISRLRPWLSDALCRLASGGGFAVRQLYTDQDEVLFDAARPVILNGIEELITRPDLADRS